MPLHKFSTLCWNVKNVTTYLPHCNSYGSMMRMHTNTSTNLHDAMKQFIIMNIHISSSTVCHLTHPYHLKFIIKLGNFFKTNYYFCSKINLHFVTLGPVGHTKENLTFWGSPRPDMRIVPLGSSSTNFKHWRVPQNSMIRWSGLFWSTNLFYVKSSKFHTQQKHALEESHLWLLGLVSLCLSQAATVRQHHWGWLGDVTSLMFLSPGFWPCFAQPSKDLVPQSSNRAPQACLPCLRLFSCLILHHNFCVRPIDQQTKPT